MVKKLTIFAVVFLVGCASPQIRLKTEVQESYVPILYCPAPPQITHPTLAIEGMSSEDLQDSGEVVKHYKATIIQLQGVIDELETTLDQYDKNNEAYKELEKEFDAKWKEKQKKIEVPK